jgi:hypothetical protein
MMGIVILINKYTSATIMGIVIGAALGESGRDRSLRLLPVEILDVRELLSVWLDQGQTMATPRS